MSQSSYSIVAIPAFTDNYIWCLHNDTHAVVVDPGDASPVLAYLSKYNLQLTDVLITHHHHDHTGGIADLKTACDSLKVYGPTNHKINGISQHLSQGDVVNLDSIDACFEVIEIPGHTLDHIGFFNEQALFCGDTLFSAGCGRMFEGTPDMFLASLDKLADLPGSTKVYCTHEYTLANLTFAQHVDADNKHLSEYACWATQQRAQSQITLPSDIDTQLKINPFLRVDHEQIKNFVASSGNLAKNDRVSVFAALRGMKDSF